MTDYDSVPGILDEVERVASMPVGAPGSNARRAWDLGMRLAAAESGLEMTLRERDAARTAHAAREAELSRARTSLSNMCGALGQYGDAVREIVRQRDEALARTQLLEEDGRRLQEERDAARTAHAAREAELSRARTSLSNMCGALVDSGVTVPEEEWQYGDAVREIVRQRDEARRQRAERGEPSPQVGTIHDRLRRWVCPDCATRPGAKEEPAPESTQRWGVRVTRWWHEDNYADGPTSWPTREAAQAFADESNARRPHERYEVAALHAQAELREGRPGEPT